VRLRRNSNRQIPLSASKTKPKQAPGYRKKANAAFKRAYEQLFGSQGAASPVRKIDPVTGEVIGFSNPINWRFAWGNAVKYR
jgi:hypothetical protein